MLRCIAALAVLFIASVETSCAAEDAAELHKKGIDALKESQSKPEAIVTAARYFAKASELFEAAGKSERAVEANSFLYYCKKKMTMKDIDSFLKTETATVSERLKQVESNPVAQSEAQTWLDRADGFARSQPGEHFLIAVRYFEVAERFKDTDAGRSAMSKSLDAMQKVIAAQKPATAANKSSVNETAARKPINLLQLIDPSKDAIAGKWSFNGNVLIVEKEARARIEIPYRPPEEYDFKIVFMRTTGRSDCLQILCKGEQQFDWVMDGWDSPAAGLELIDSKVGGENETTFKGKLVTNNQWHTSIVQVRDSGVTVIFDGKPIAKYTKSYSSFSLPSYWKLHDMTVLGLGSHVGTVGYSTIELTEITGTGQRTR